MGDGFSQTQIGSAFHSAFAVQVFLVLIKRILTFKNIFTNFITPTTETTNYNWDEADVVVNNLLVQSEWLRSGAQASGLKGLG